jgi:hypothetical protein
MQLKKILAFLQAQIKRLSVRVTHRSSPCGCQPRWPALSLPDLSLSNGLKGRSLGVPYGSVQCRIIASQRRTGAPTCAPAMPGRRCYDRHCSPCNGDHSPSVETTHGPSLRRCHVLIHPSRNHRGHPRSSAVSRRSSVVQEGLAQVAVETYCRGQGGEVDAFEGIVQP